jgi:hypothetical protein
LLKHHCSRPEIKQVCYCDLAFSCQFNYERVENLNNLL